jgi:diguanylate cyclase (GGDEF)-like protein
MTFHWSTHQLTEYLVSVSRPGNTTGAMQIALERAIEAVEAEVGVVIIDGEVRTSMGFGARGVPEAFLLTGNRTGAETGTGAVRTMELPGSGLLHLAGAALNKVAGRPDATSDRLITGRLHDSYDAEEIQMLQAMGLVLGLVLHNLNTLEAERSRHRLVETLLAIQRSISARRPLQELLDGVTEGASSLLGGCPVALLLSDPTAQGALLPVSGFDFIDLDETSLAAIDLAMAGGQGRAELSTSGDEAVITQPVVVNDEVTGCLAARVKRTGAGSRDQGELLSAFAQQVSLALNDARTLDAVREAHHDTTTGLPNRALFLQRLDRARRLAGGRDLDLTVLFIDLDGFKAVNDTLGHQAGDELLAEVGRRIKSCLRPDDLAARLGGDEFGVLLDGADVDVATVLAARIIDELARAFVISGREVFIGASVGIAPLTSTHQDAGALLSDADVAMYCAKRAGRGRSVVFEPRMLDDVAKRLSLRTDLQHAQSSEQLWLAYQPIVQIDDGRLRGVEALLRWKHPERGQLMPSEFVPVAEETQVIVEIGAWVMRNGLAEVARWQEGSPGLGLSVNVSARQIADPGLPAVIAAALDVSGFPAEALTIEITESILMEDPDSARNRLSALKDLGIRLAIDDFGTGYSSLAYVRQFPVDDVKIDQSFIAGLKPGAADDIAVVRSVLSLCDSLRLLTVAEGIERPEQWAILADLGCQFGQGYLFARPMSPEHWPDYARASLLSPAGASFGEVGASAT